MLTEHHNAFFHHDLHLAGPLLQISAQKNADGAQENSDDQMGDGGLGDVDAAENGNGEINKCTVNTYVHF